MQTRMISFGKEQTGTKPLTFRPTLKIFITCGTYDSVLKYIVPIRMRVIQRKYPPIGQNTMDVIKVIKRLFLASRGPEVLEHC